MLHMENVTVTFQDGEERLTALDNVSFEATPGHLTFIVGSRPIRAPCLSTMSRWTPASGSKKSA